MSKVNINRIYASSVVKSSLFRTLQYWRSGIKTPAVYDVNKSSSRSCVKLNVLHIFLHIYVLTVEYIQFHKCIMCYKIEQNRPHITKMIFMLENKLNWVTIIYVTKVSFSLHKSTKCLCQMLANPITVSDAAQTSGGMNSHMKNPNI